MKYLSALLFAFVVVVAAGCHPNPANYTHPAGYQPCDGPGQCRHGHCGFVGVDTYPVCIP